MISGDLQFILLYLGFVVLVCWILWALSPLLDDDNEENL